MGYRLTLVCFRYGVRGDCDDVTHLFGLRCKIKRVGDVNTVNFLSWLTSQSLVSGSQYEAAVDRREGINKAVQNDVQHIFKGR